MGAVRRFASRLVSLVRPHHHDAALAREVASHLTMLEEDYRRRGLSPAEARRQARLALGGEDQTQEWSRDARTFRWLDDARRDGLYAMRMLRRRPLVAVTAVSSLAIGIGLNAAVFSVVDWVLLRPLPYPQPHQLVRVFTAGTAPVTGPSPVTAQEYARFGASTAFRSSAAYTTATRVVAGSAVDPAHVVIARVTGDLFATLGVVPEVGRGFSREEIAAGSPVVVVSQTLWHRQFAADRTIVGRVVRIDGVPHTVVGVMPARQGYPRDAEVWSPLTSREREDDDRELSMVARLHGETTRDRASAEMSTIASTNASGTRTAWVEDAAPRSRSGAGRAPCASLRRCSRSSSHVPKMWRHWWRAGRRRVGEMAVRSALGASRRRLFGQLITETVVHRVACDRSMLDGSHAERRSVGDDREAGEVVDVNRPRLTESALPVKYCAERLGRSTMTARDRKSGADVSTNLRFSEIVSRDPVSTRRRASVARPPLRTMRTRITGAVSWGRHGTISPAPR